MSLLDIFLELDIPQTENSKLINATALINFPFAKIGVNYFGFPVILISSKFDQMQLAQKNIKLRYIELTHNLQCKVLTNDISESNSYSVIIFKSNEITLQNYFLGVAKSLLNSLSKKPTQKEISEIFKIFIEIFRSLAEPSAKTVQGLWAELILIEQSKKPETLINYWHNFPEEKFDFNADKQKIEVKSSSHLERVHYFTSEQLNPSEDNQVVIASIFTKQVSNGLNLIDLLDKIGARVSENTLLDKVYRIVSKTLGNTFEQAVNTKFDYILAKESLLFYRHQDISKVEKNNIPKKVSEVKFKSNLTNIQPIDFAEKLVKGQLFDAL